MKYLIILLSLLGLAKAQQAGSLAPEFKLVDSESNVIELKDFGGQPLVLNFWASWCTPCKEELPLLQELSEDVAGITILLINNSERLEQVSAYLESNAITLRTAVDTESFEEVDKTLTVLRRYRVRGLPTTVFIDAEGYISSQYVGQLSSKILTERLAEIGVSWQP